MQEYLMAAGIREAEESTWDTELSWILVPYSMEPGMAMAATSS
jgi:hypothetical protein